MPRVTITLDLQRLLLPRSDAQLVESVADYVPTCLALRQTLHTSSGHLEVFVHDVTAGAWLRALADAYGPDHIVVSEHTAQQALADRWNVVIPATVSRQDIVQAGLLDIQVTPRAGQTFEDVLLEYFYGDFFAYSIFPVERLASFISGVDLPQWQANERKPLVIRTFRDRLTQWERKETNEARRWLIDRLRTDPAQLREKLGAYKLIRNYPASLVGRTLGEAADSLRRAKVDVDELSLGDLNLSEIITEIRYYLGSARSRISSADELVSLLDLMSGCLLDEFEVIETLVQRQPKWLEVSLMRRIEQRFAPIRDRIATRLARLAQLIPPAYPTPPDSDWNVDAWLAWVRDSYMPYHRWLEAQQRHDETVAEYAAVFADWYYKHFIALKRGFSQHFTFSGLYLDRDRFVQGDAVTLVILLDNFNYSYIDDLRLLFNQAGFSMMDERPMLSLIPTATEVGKPSIIMSTGDQSDVPDINYRAQVAESWGSILQQAGKSGMYLANIGELQRLNRLEHGFYVLNYLPVDHALHANALETGQEHAEVIHGYLQQMVKSIAEFAKQFGIEKRLLVYITSDHGSTRIGSEVVNILDQAFFKNISIDKHHRYIAVTDEQLTRLPSVVAAQCYVIDRERFNTVHNYLIAQKYYRFAATTEDFFVHGGLSPEEVVVPFLRFEMRPVEVITPTVRLLNKQFRYAVKSVVELELGNPNLVALDHVRLKLVGLDADEAHIESLESNGVSKTSLSAVFKKEPGAGITREIVARLYFECQGRKFGPIDVPFTITMRALMEEKNDFDL